MTAQTSTPLNASHVKTLLIGLSVLFAAVLLLGAFRFFSAQSVQDEQTALSQAIEQQLQNIDNEQDLARLASLLDAAEQQGLFFPEANYSRIYRQWEMSLKRFDHLLNVSENPFLTGTAPGLVEEVRSDLFSLRDSCSMALKNAERNHPSALWKLYNLRGCVSIMLAYTILEFDEDGQKSQKFLGDAMEDLKKAIPTADQHASTLLEQNIPRWNLELIVGKGESLNIGQGYAQEQTLAEIKDQLQATLPNVGGYAPGVPLETRVEK